MLLCSLFRVDGTIYCMLWRLLKIVIDNNSHVSLIGRSESCEFAVSVEVDLKSIHLKYKLYSLAHFLSHIWIGYVNISQSLIFDVVYNKMA